MNPGKDGAEDSEAGLPEEVLEFASAFLSAKAGRNKVTISWKPVEDADKYVICCAKVGEKLKKYKTVTDTDKLTCAITGMGKNAYKVYVYAYKGSRRLGKSKKLVAYSKNGRRTNAKSVTIRQKKIRLTVGTGNKLSAGVEAEAAKKKLHNSAGNPKLSYYSTNENIAKVDRNGKVTGVAEGECYVLAVALNGCYDAVKVAVSK